MVWLVLHRHIGGLENKAVPLLLRQLLHRHIGGLENVVEHGYN